MKNMRPMTKDRFKKAMMAGLGRCYITLRTGDKEFYRDVVQQACLNNFTYDTQSDGTPERYVYALVNCYDDPLSFLPALLNKFATLDFSVTNDWDILYYTRLLTLFARDGARDAAEIIRTRYEEVLTILKDPDRVVEGYVDYDEEIYTILGSALLKTDGTDAYVKLAKDMNYLNVNLHIRCADLPWIASAIKRLPTKPDFVTFVREHSDEDLSAFLSDYELAKDNPYSYLADEKKEEADNKEAYNEDDETEEEEASAEETATDEDEPDVSKEPVSFRPFYRWANACEDPRLWDTYPDVEDLIDAARAASAETLAKLRPYRDKPNDIELKKLIRYLNHYDDDVRDEAEDIFIRRTDTDAVDYAIMRLGMRGPEWWTLHLLIMRYVPENEQIICYMMNKLSFDLESKDCWHGAVSAVIDAIYDCKIDLPQSILSIVYERSLCRNCRMNAFRELYKKGWVTPEMEEECYFDANDDLVEFAEEHHFKKATFEK